MSNTESKPEVKQEANAALQVESKKCFKCGEVKLLNQFYRAKDKKRIPYSSQCKQCIVAKNESHRLRRLEENKLRKKKDKLALRLTAISNEHVSITNETAEILNRLEEIEAEKKQLRELHPKRKGAKADAANVKPKRKPKIIILHDANNDLSSDEHPVCSIND